MNQIEQYAEFNFHNRQTNTAADDVPAELAEIDEAAAYAIQDKLVAQLTEMLGTETAGYKIGCTSKGAQELLNTDGPVYGQLLAATNHESPVTLHAADFSMLVIEPEFAFALSQDVPAGAYDAETIRPYVASVIPSIEIVHHRLGGWDRFDALKTIADNAIHGAWVAGSPTADLDSLDLPNHEVKLFADGKQIRTGYGHIALGNPLVALAWIANELPQYGRQLKAGEVVTTGVCMDVYTAAKGETIIADFGRLGEVAVVFD